MHSLTGIIARSFGRLNKARVAWKARSIAFENSSTHPRPARLIAGGRSIDNSFRWHHSLYQRCTKEDVVGTRLLAARISYKEPSVNWSKYSKPWDVLFDHPRHGIAQHMVFALPRDVPKGAPEGTKLNSFRPVHDPMSDNYPHCEIRTFREGSQISGKALGELAKKGFRTIMSDRSVILWDPTS